MTEVEELVPTATKFVYLLAVPPSSHRSDQHKYVQLQRIVHRADKNSGLRIKPIFNLEYHRLFATRIIELERDDQKIAEFHPAKHHVNTSSLNSDDTNDGEHQRRVSQNRGRGRRQRANSIDHKRGAHGGRVTSLSSAHGLCDMTVVGSVREGVFLFQCADGQAFTWRKDREALGSRWVLDKDVTGPQTSDERGHRLPTDLLDPCIREQEEKQPPAARTSYEFHALDVPRRPISRTDSGNTLASQYTTEFENESQLSGLAESPQADDLEWVNEGDSRRRAVESDETVLSSVPMPHLRVHISDASAGRRHSMRQITASEDRVYRLLLTAMWLTWSSSDITQVVDTDVQCEEAVAGAGDRTSKYGNVDAVDTAAAGKHLQVEPARIPSDETSDTKHNKKKKGGRGGIMRRIARICG